jgi:hypothetical protein
MEHTDDVLLRLLHGRVGIMTGQIDQPLNIALASNQVIVVFPAFSNTAI